MSLFWITVVWSSLNEIQRYSINGETRQVGSYSRGGIDGRMLMTDDDY